MDRETIFTELSDIQERVGLKEGIYGLVRLIASIGRHSVLSMKNLSQINNLPIPICVAIRNEFEKKGWCEKDSGGTKLSNVGLEVMSALNPFNDSFLCNECEGEGMNFPFEKYKKQLKALERFAELRGAPDTTIDQSYATPETSLVRVLLMSNEYDLFYNNYVFVGDSDLTSIALALQTPPSTRIVVFDVDLKLKSILMKANEELKINIEFVEHDFRKPIPQEFQNQFDCFLTDPPYTRNGVKLFVSRGIQLLNKQEYGACYLSFGTKPPNELLQIQTDLTQMGCLITDIWPAFNQYIGAQKLGGVSTLYKLLIDPSAKQLVDEEFNEQLYTGEKNPVIRYYVCKNCEAQFEIGYNREFITIEKLKENKCPKCNNEVFRKVGEKKIE